MKNYIAIVKINGGASDLPIVLKIGKYQDSASALLGFAHTYRKWLLQTNIESIVICPEEDESRHRKQPDEPPKVTTN